MFSNLGDNSQAALLSGLMGLGGNIVSGVGQAGQQAGQNAMSREQSYLQAGQGQDQLALQRQQLALQASQADPLAQQKSRQQQALLAAIMPGLRNASVSSGMPGMDRFIPQVSGGLRLPEGGFDADTLKMFSPESRANAEGSFYQQNQNTMRAPNLSNVGYGQAGQGVTGGSQQAFDRADAESQAKRAAMMSALQQSQAGAASAAKGPSTAAKVGGTAAGAGIAMLPLLLGMFGKK